MIEPNGENPWDVQSIYQLQFFNCPSCDFKDLSKQEFINHAHLSHFGAVKYLMNINDGSLDDVFCPWNNHQLNYKVELSDSKMEINNDDFFEICNDDDEDKENAVNSSFYYEDNLNYFEDISDNNMSDKKSSIKIPQIDKTKCKASILLERIQSGYFECALCQKIFEYEPLLNIHYHQYHDIKNRKYSIKCDDATSANSMILRKNDVKKDKIIQDVKSCHVMTVHEGKITKQSYKCEQCPDLEFRLKKELVNHNIKVHDIKDHVCQQCSKKFSKLNTLERHIKQVHEGIRTHQCSKCDEKFAFKFQLKDHMAVIHKIGEGVETFQCSECERKYLKKYDLDYHVMTVHEGKNTKQSYKCQQCPDLEFRLKKEYSQHNFRVHGEKSSMCQQCGKSFSEPRALLRHMRQVHEGIRTHQCEKCDEKFGFKFQLKDHMAVIHEIGEVVETFQCSECERKYLKKSDLEYHVMTVHEGKNTKQSYKCEQCPDLEFRLKKEYLQHNFRVHGQKSSMCEQCGKAFSEPRALQRHMRRVHEGIKKNYPCEKCSLTFTEVVHLRNHKAVVHGDIEQQYSCDKCSDFVTHNKQYLRQHIILVHEKPEELRCQTCKKQFFKLSELSTHTKAVHSKLKDVLCDKCNKGFSNKGQLAKHMKRVHEGSKYYSCSYCGKQFHTPNQLNLHVIQYHEQEKQHQCDQCPYRHASLGILKVHIDSVHKKLRNFKCSKCPKHFSTSYRLKLHHDFVHENIKTFKCDYVDCDHQFATPHGVKLHIKIFHLGQKDHKCDKCGKEYGSASHLKRHLLTKNCESSSPSKFKIISSKKMKKMNIL